MITRPKPRSKLRITLGMMYFRGKRHLEWIFGKTRYAGHKQSELLPYEIFRHETPVYRNLPRVDRWLQDNKKINLQLAVRRLNGIVIQPGETFSYWRLIGKPTRRRGYVDGMVLFYGRFKTGVGGGLCQLSNLIYWTALHTPLVVTERQGTAMMSFPIRTGHSRSEAVRPASIIIWNCKSTIRGQSPISSSLRWRRICLSEGGEAGRLIRTGTRLSSKSIGLPRSIGAVTSGIICSAGTSSTGTGTS